MSPKNRYRSLMITGISAAVLLTAACAEAPKKSASAIGLENWHKAQIKIQLQLANQQYEVGDYDACRKSLAEAFGLNEPDADLHTLAAKVDIEKGALDSAATHLKEAIQIKSDDPEPYYLLGVVYQRWQKMEVAEDYYQQAWNRKSNEARYMLAMVEMMISRGNLDEAQQLLTDKASYFEQNAALRGALARIASLKGDYVAASRYYRDAYLLSPDDDNLKRAYAESLFFAGRYSDAAPILETLRTPTTGPDGEVVEREESDRVAISLMLGQAYISLHRAMEARAAYQDVIKAQPDNVQALLGLGRVCVETNELAAALSTGKRVIRMEPDNVQAMMLVAMIQQKQKNWSDALTTLEGAAAHAPKDATIMCMQGLSLIKLGKREDAQAVIEKAIATNPNDAWAMELLSEIKPEQGHASAVDLNTKTIDIKPGDGPDQFAATPTIEQKPLAEAPATQPATQPQEAKSPDAITNAAPSTPAPAGADAP